MATSKMNSQAIAKAWKLLSSSTGANGREFQEFVCTTAPEYFDSFYPRRYRQSGEFYSPKLLPALALSVVCGYIVEQTKGGMEQERVSAGTLTSLCSLEQTRKYRVPAFFLKRRLMDALLQSDLRDIPWTTMQLPFESGMLVFPVGNGIVYEGKECSIVVWSRLQAECYLEPEAHQHFPWAGFEARGIRNDNPYFSFTAYFGVGGDSLGSSCVFGISANKTPVLSSTEISRLFDDGHEMDTSSDLISKILFNAFLAISARPDLLTKGQRDKVVKGTGGQKIEYWTPNVIGEHYRAKREAGADEARAVVAGGAVGTAGSHASPRLHWRRGHFRNQAYGEQRRERKVIWVEPMLVGAEA